MPSSNEIRTDQAGTEVFPRILIVAESTSTRFGGEAALPWHYFRLLRDRGIEAWLVTHARTQNELLELLPGEASRFYFLPDTAFDKFCGRLSNYLPSQLFYITLGYMSRLKTQLAARRVVRQLVEEKQVDVVHQPIPVSPREPSLMHSLARLSSSAR